jgi:hypothetical protein
MNVKPAQRQPPKPYLRARVLSRVGEGVNKGWMRIWQEQWNRLRADPSSLVFCHPGNTSSKAAK